MTWAVVDTVIVAVKPGTVTAALSEVSHMKSSVLVLSVARASHDAIESVLPENPVVRVAQHARHGRGRCRHRAQFQGRDEHVRRAIEIWARPVTRSSTGIAHGCGDRAFRKRSGVCGGRDHASCSAVVG